LYLLGTPVIKNLEGDSVQVVFMQRKYSSKQLIGMYLEKLTYLKMMDLSTKKRLMSMAATKSD
jgi:hypothetical protein